MTLFKRFPKAWSLICCAAAILFAVPSAPAQNNNPFQQNPLNPSNPFQQNPLNPNNPFQQNPLNPNNPFQQNPLNPNNPFQQNQFQPGIVVSQQRYTLGVLGTFTPQGLVVQRIAPNSPAAGAGVRISDIIVKVDNVVVVNQAQFDRAVQTSGGTVKLLVRRGGKTAGITVNLIGGGTARVRAPYMLGIKGIGSPQGVLIQTVYPGTPAQRIGLKVGETITRINGQPIQNMQTFHEVLSYSAGNAEVEVRRGFRPTKLRTRLQLYKFGSLGMYLGLGTRVEVLAPNTPAAFAGIRLNDTIRVMDGRVIRNQNDFAMAVNQSGGSVLVQMQSVVGGPRQVKVDVVNNSLGCWCEPVQGGMRILSLNRGRLAQQMGLTRGDIIFQIDNRQTQTLQQLQNALENARGLMTVDYRSGVTGQLRRLQVNLQ